MPKRTTIKEYLTVAELENGYRICRDVTERERWLMIKLLASGKTVAQVSEITGCTRKWICEIARRYNQLGANGLVDRRRTLPGVKPLLDENLRAELERALQKPPPTGGQWSGVKVAAWISERLGRPVCRQIGWVYLRLLNYTPQIPRPTHIHTADKKERAAFKKKLKRKVAALQKKHPKAQVEVWSEDEHRLGLLSVPRKIWARRGQRPVVRVQPRQEWLYLFGFCCPENGASYWLLMPSVNLTVMNLVLAEFAKAQGIGPDKQVVLVIDGAGWHRSSKLEIPEGLHLVFLPPYTPELQPAERLWELTDEGLANRHFKTLDDLEEAQSQWCRRLSRDYRAQIQSRTCYHWWPKVAA